MYASVQHALLVTSIEQLYIFMQLQKGFSRFFVLYHVLVQYLLEIL